MDNKLIKPYEISVWEDKLVQNGNEYEFTETKIAVIGSDTMTGLNKVYNPVFNKKSNGEKSLSFSLRYKYFDPYTGNSDIINPFAALLVNERKVKLKYGIDKEGNDQWYEFIVKEHTESSDGLEWTYTCTDAFVLELSKNGYNITFDAELNNNQGTARELAKETLKNTDWQLGSTNVGRQMVAEPIYKATLKSIDNIDLINATGDETPLPTANTLIYIFYSYVKNKSGKFVQFIIRDEENQDYIIDSNNVITATNFRILNELEFKDDGFYLDNTQIIAIDEVETKFQANRLVYAQRTTYDPVMQRTVDLFQADDREIYRYTDYTYTTSNVVMNYITNGENFNLLEDGSLQGWNPYVDFTGREQGEKIDKLELLTKPEIGADKDLADISILSQIEGFLKTNFKGPLTNDYRNAIYNSGFENNTAFIKTVAQGEQFVLRWRAGVRDSNEYILSEDETVDISKIYYQRSIYEPYIYTEITDFESDSNPSELNWYEQTDVNDIDCLVPYQNLRLLVAKYTQDDPTRYGYYYKYIDPNDIIMDFNTNDEGVTLQILNNIIQGGSLENVYELTKDTTIVLDKTYYQRVGTEDHYVYAPVLQPLPEYLSTYYEITHKDYVIDDVPQVPSTKYIYEVVENSITKQYVWNGLVGDFELLDDVHWSNYLPYYCVVATVKKGVSNTDLTDPTQKFGIFIYTTDGTTPVYIQDIQLTRFVPDSQDETGNTPILIGNIPTATSNLVEYYYLKPEKNKTAEEIELYTSLEALQDALGGSEVDIKPVYNEDSEKILSISVSKSNCFNILQTIAETFECWVDLKVAHDARGYIQCDEDGRPRKYVYLNEYAGDDNYAGFKYGINLNSIERTVNSDEIVTKLIVDQSQSDLVDEGFISIANAPSNQSGESYILNFDYYYSQNLLDKEDTEADRLQFISEIAEINSELQEKEKKRRDLEASLTSLGSKRNVYSELIATAQETKTDSLLEFEDLTGYGYEEYREAKMVAIPFDNSLYVLTRDEEIVQDKVYFTYDIETGVMTAVAEPIATELENYYELLAELTEEDTIFSIIGNLYVSSATINNYSGLLTNINQEYESVRKQLYGSENYSVKVWVDKDSNNQRHLFIEVNDYLPGFHFTIDGSSYDATVSKKYWDIETSATEITLYAPVGYLIESQQSVQYTINDNKTAKFKIAGTRTVYGIIDEIEDIQAEKDRITNEFNNKYSRYIQEGTWNSTDYIDSELYYLDALQISNTSALPAVSYTINVVEISELEGFEWYLFDAGDKTYIEDTEFFGWAKINIGTTNEPNYVRTPAREEVIISEVEWHLDEPDQNIITVQNYKTRFEDLFQRISATVQTVQYNEATYAKMSSLLDANGTINQNVLLESLNRLSGQKYNLTSDGSVMIDGDVVLIQNLTNPTNRVIINSEGIRVSSDGGQTWRTAIDGQGINVETVYTGTLNTNNIIIGNSDNPSFRWDKSGISAYRSYKTTINGQEVDRYDLQNYVRYDQYGLYGIKNDGKFKAQDLQDVKDNAHFAITWDGFFIRNSYEGGGQVEITSENDFRVLNKVDGRQNEKIKIGALEWMVPADAEDFDEDKTYYLKIGDKYEVVEHPIFSDVDIYYEKKLEPQKGVEPSLYGIRILNNDGVEVMKTDDNGDLTIVGTIEALAANFSQMVTVGKNDPTVTNWIEIDGVHSLIQTSDYSDGAGHGWQINKDGNAVFNNITARGAIKTAVFEYAEIQAVGGIFIFRPSSTIKTAAVEGNDLVVTVEKPMVFKSGQWCKVSNYANGSYGPNDLDINGQVLQNNGLSNVYQIQLERDQYIGENRDGDSILDAIIGTATIGTSTISSTHNWTYKIRLIGAAEMVEGVSACTDLASLVGGALVDMGNTDGTENYGIGVNSSDNTVNLPAKAISLFETTVDNTEETKISYDFQAILGTLPKLAEDEVSSYYHKYLTNTQGIYTDNMYIGDKTQYIAFYTDTDDNNRKKLRISTSELIFEDDGQGHITTWDDHINSIIATDNNQHFWFLSSDIDRYKLTTDTEVVPQKIYYTRNGDGTEENPYRYVPVQNPSGDPEDEGWYESDGTILAGAYITNADIDDFKNNPHGYNNLLSRNDGVYIRNGLNTLASFTNSGLAFNNPDTYEASAVLDNTGLNITEGSITLGREINEYYETIDNQIDLNKTYYRCNEANDSITGELVKTYVPVELDDDLFIKITLPDGNPNEHKWYEKVDDTYIITLDTQVNTSKTYYISKSPAGESFFEQRNTHAYKIDSNGHFDALTGWIGGAEQYVKLLQDEKEVDAYLDVRVSKLEMPVGDILYGKYQNIVDILEVVTQQVGFIDLWKESQIWLYPFQYELTTDVLVDEGKIYYEFKNEQYSKVENPSGNPQQANWYEAIYLTVYKYIEPNSQKVLYYYNTNELTDGEENWVTYEGPWNYVVEDNFEDTTPYEAGVYVQVDDEYVLTTDMKVREGATYYNREIPLQTKYLYGLGGALNFVEDSLHNQQRLVVSSGTTINEKATVEIDPYFINFTVGPEDTSSLELYLGYNESNNTNHIDIKHGNESIFAIRDESNYFLETTTGYKIGELGLFHYKNGLVIGIV